MIFKQSVTQWDFCACFLLTISEILGTMIERDTLWQTIIFFKFQSQQDCSNIKVLRKLLKCLFLQKDQLRNWTCLQMNMSLLNRGLVCVPHISRDSIHIRQRFPNFFWSRTICQPCIFTAYRLENTLFQENSFYPNFIQSKLWQTTLDANAAWTKWLWVINKMAVTEPSK